MGYDDNAYSATYSFSEERRREAVIVTEAVTVGGKRI